MKHFTYFTITNSLLLLLFGLTNTFGIAYLYKRSEGSFLLSIGLIILIRILYIIILPTGTKLVGRIGTRSSVIVFMILLLLSNASLILVDSSIFFLYLWIILSAVAYIFFFIPTALFTSKYTETKTRGIQMGRISSTILFATAFAPLITGEVLDRYSITGFVLLLALIIIISLFFVPKLKNIHFDYLGGLKKFRFNKSLLRGSWIEACHYSTRNLGIFWSLYIFIFFDENYKKFGLLLTAITLFSAFVNIIVGKYLNQHNKKDIIKTQAIFSPFSWIFRILAVNPLSIFFADAFHSLNGYIRESAIESTAFDLMSRDGHKEILDEKFVVREIIINIGIILTLSAGVILTMLFGIKSSFILGIIISLGYLLI
ncbi:MFS transporter [Candidatus Dojkabacteria bacterium]|uniref:MFS transporter n=1 Tax=Candidatus Dojkabacteria bacterium TaxID=2099670 RepID=A0A955I852_9BACT|nr:MFS transporter [Candidatus Dojkabacteria bacterium]